MFNPFQKKKNLDLFFCRFFFFLLFLDKVCFLLAAHIENTLSARRCLLKGLILCQVDFFWTFTFCNVLKLCDVCHISFSRVSNHAYSVYLLLWHFFHINTTMLSFVASFKEESTFLQLLAILFFHPMTVFNHVCLCCVTSAFLLVQSLAKLIPSLQGTKHPSKLQCFLAICFKTTQNIRQFDLKGESRKSLVTVRLVRETLREQF